MLRITLVLFIVCEAVAQVSGGCPDVKTVPNFNVTAYMGTWYEAKRFFSVFEDGSKCVTIDYAPAENGSVRITHTQTSSLSGETSSIEGIARPIVATDDAEWIVKFSSLDEISGRYSILGTDYENWAVLFSCRKSGSISVPHAWILMRARNPTDKALDHAYKVVDENKINRKLFIPTNQRNCPKTHS